EATLRVLFNEELGAVLQVRRADRARLQALAVSHGLDKILHPIGEPREKLGIKLFLGSETVMRGNWTQWLSAWQETSHAMQRLRDNPVSADAERAWRIDDADPGLSPKLGFEPGADIAAPFIASGARPRVAILREQGVNGEVEMAAAFTRAGFEAVDVHMS
ncbi:phosphoribosylformylglycinamidine (FGAM) synthase, partial [mine drainage metagenome]